MKLLAAYTTVGSEADAHRLAEMAVVRGLAACVQMSHCSSVYVWDGSMQRDDEVRILFKTVDSRYHALRAAVLESHPYDLPAFWAVEVTEAHEPYAAWVAASCRAGE